MASSEHAHHQDTGTPVTENTTGFQAWRPYLQECRWRCAYALVATGLMFCVLLPFASLLYQQLAQPLLQVLPSPTLLATTVTSPLLVPIKLALYCAFIVTLPLWIYHIWSFVVPALTINERRSVFALTLPCVALFYLGMWVAYQWVFALLFRILLLHTPEAVVVLPEIGAFLALAMKLMCVFGLCFQVPVVTFLMCYTGMTSIAACRRARPAVIVAAFVLGMLLTPPDVVSQILVALPIWFLFELGLLVYYFYARATQRTAQTETSK